MALTSTVQVVWRPDRGRWTVEGGHGTTATLGVVSVHESKVAAIRAAHRVAREHGVEVQVVGRPGAGATGEGADGPGGGER